MSRGLQSAVRPGAGGVDREASLRGGTMMNSGHLATGPEGYGAIREGAAWARLSGRTVLTASGRDAVRFLDGFTTAAVSRLACGGGTEGFLADARGWVIALVDLLREADGVRLEAGPGLGPRLLAHLEHYHIREDVSLVDASPARTTFVVVGPETPAWLERRVGVAMPEHVLDHHPAVVADGAASIVRTDWYGMPGVRIQVASEVGERHGWRPPDCPSPRRRRSTPPGSRPAIRSRTTSPTKRFPRNSIATRGPSPSPRAATSGRRPSPASMPSATPTGGWWRSPAVTRCRERV